MVEKNGETGNRVTDALLKEGLITPQQSKRLSKLLAQGMDPHEAVGKTPLVEAVKLTGILAKIQRESGETKVTPKRTSKSAIPLPPPSKSSTKVPKQKIKDFTPIVGDVIDAALELDDSDLLPLELDGGEKFVIEDHGPVTTPIHDCSTSDEIPVKDLDLDLEIDTSALKPETSPKTPLPGETKALQKQESEREPSTAEKQAITDTHAADTQQLGTPELGSDLDLDLDMDFDPPPMKTSDMVELHMGELDLDADVDSALEGVFDGALGGDEDSPHQDFLRESKSMVDLEGLKARPIRQSVSSTEIPLTLKLPDEPETYDCGKLVTYNLFDDEGITLIHEVNQRLLRVVEISGQGMVLDRASPDNNFRVYNARWMLEEQRTLSEPEIDKMINRIRVMARLQAWKRNELQKGRCIITAGSNTFRLLVESRPIQQGREVLTVYFMEE